MLLLSLEVGSLILLFGAQAAINADCMRPRLRAQALHRGRQRESREGSESPAAGACQ